MNRPSRLERLTQQEDLNFLLTNRIPRRTLTLAMGWFSRIEQPLVRWLSLATWQLFAGRLDLSEARKTRFDSLHDCFVRELKPGARPVDEATDVLVSPCDGIVGACGRIDGTEVVQAKGQPYTVDDLLGGPDRAERYRDGSYVTLRLTSTMYHRFHAPYACDVDEVIYVSGDTWNVNPIALRRVPRLFCLNERAVIPLRLRASRAAVTLVPVAAILVASIHLEFLDVTLHLRYRGPDRLACRASLEKGQEMGHFRHGSTIIVLASGELELHPSVREGETIRVGRPLFRHR
ncbi:MAG: phosphatidylserine decarboxylase [Acidobacteria bacterium]|nr:phosphatidylserine decarboxylase [Acidobacteriota bacterium]